MGWWEISYKVGEDILTNFGSKLTLYTGVPLDNSYENTFSTTTLLNSIDEVTGNYIFPHDIIGDRYYYIKPDKNTIKIEHNGNMNVTGIGVGTTLNLYNCNYLTFENVNYENKRFYCFITDVRYISDKTAEIDFEVDVMMTWLKHVGQNSGCNFKECYIDRQHTDTDNYGEHILDEGMEIGDYLYNPIGTNDNVLLCIGLSAYYRADSGKWTAGKGEIVDINGNRVWIGIYYYWFNVNTLQAIVPQIFDKTPYYIQASGFSNFTDMQDTMSAEGSGFTDEIIKEIKYVPYVQGITTITRENPFSFIPKNNKTLIFPYCGLYVTNYEGTSSYYRYEFFDGDITFSKFSDVISAQAICYPNNYKKDGYNNIISKNNYPLLSANRTEYSSVLALQKSKENVDQSNVAFSGLMPALIGGGPEVGAISFITSAFQTSLQRQQERDFASMRGGTPTGKIQGLTQLYGSGTKNLLNIAIYKFNITNEYAKSIDDFFTKYGYKVKSLATPTLPNNGFRFNWKFIKTIGCALDGYAPATAMSKIEEIMDNGITFWTITDVGNYTV